MKKFLMILLTFQILVACQTMNPIQSSDIDNSTSKFEHYIVNLNSGEKIKTKYVFDRGENIEIYSQGQSKFYPKSEIKNIAGTNDDNRKGWIILGSTIAAASALSLILINNGAEVTYGK